MVADGGITPYGAGPTTQLTDPGLFRYLGAAEGVPEGGDVWRARGRPKIVFYVPKMWCECL